jgi:hypothetical protein
VFNLIILGGKNGNDRDNLCSGYRNRGGSVFIVDAKAAVHQQLGNTVGAGGSSHIGRKRRFTPHRDRD